MHVGVSSCCLSVRPCIGMFVCVQGPLNPSPPLTQTHHVHRQTETKSLRNMPLDKVKRCKYVVQHITYPWRYILVWLIQQMQQQCNVLIRKCDHPKDKLFTNGKHIKRHIERTRSYTGGSPRSKKQISSLELYTISQRSEQIIPINSVTDLFGDESHSNAVSRLFHCSMICRTNKLWRLMFSSLQTRS